MSFDLIKFLNNLISTEEKNYYAIIDVSTDLEISEQIKELLKVDDYSYVYKGYDVPLDLGNPYLIKLSESSIPLFGILQKKNKSKSWGIIIEVPEDTVLNSVLRHFQSLIKAKNHEGKNFYFRFYDTEVLRIFLPTCNKEQIKDFYGPVQTFYVSNESGTELLSFRKELSL